MVRSENVRDHEMVGKAGDGLARVGIAAALLLLLSRASFFTGHRVGRQTWRVSCARRCARRGFLVATLGLTFSLDVTKTALAGKRLSRCHHVISF